MNVTFTPSAAGNRTGNLTFTSNATGSPHVVTLAGPGATAPTGAATLDTTALSFPSTGTGAAATPLKSTLTNTGNAALTIFAVAIGGTNAQDFKLGAGTTCAAGALAVNASCQVEAEFKPQSDGSKTADVVVAHSAGTTRIAVGGMAMAATTSTGTPAAPAASPAGTHVLGPVTFERRRWRRDLVVRGPRIAAAAAPASAPGCGQPLDLVLVQTNGARGRRFRFGGYPECPRGQWLTVTVGISTIPDEIYRESLHGRRVRPDVSPTGRLTMRLTTKGRFAVTAMIDLALREHNGPVTLAGISQRQKISLSYLEQLFGKLRRHELVESTRGPGGGYTLGRVAKDITVADIIFAVDEPLDATQCGGKENCLDDQRCMTHDLWANLNAKMVEYLDSVSLADLVEQQKLRADKPAMPSVLHDNRPRTRAETDVKNETALT